MINIYDLLLLLLAVSTSVFAISIIVHIRKCLEMSDKVKVVIIFTLIPFLLFYAGESIANLIGNWYPTLGAWMSVIIISILGIRFLYNAFKLKQENRLFDFSRGRVIIGVAVALGMDYLILGVGLSFAVFENKIILFLMPSIIILASIIGLTFGKKGIKPEWGNRMLYLGGLLFTGISIKLTLQLLGFI